MSTIRPNLSPQLGHAQPQPKAVDPARLAAQRAFFAAAMGQAPAPAQAAAPTPQPQAAAAPQAARAASPNASEGAPQRVLRPGSIIDIRV